MEIPSLSLVRLKNAGLLVSEAFPSGHVAFPDGICVCKPAAVIGNSIPDMLGYWGDGEVPIDAPGLFIHERNGSWLVTVHEYVPGPGPGPGDFVNTWETPDQAVSDALDYFLGDPSRMAITIDHRNRTEPPNR